jgi:hypothetical protein
MSVFAEPVCFTNGSGKTSVDCLSGILCGKVNCLLLKDWSSLLSYISLNHPVMYSFSRRMRLTDSSKFFKVTMFVKNAT